MESFEFVFTAFGPLYIPYGDLNSLIGDFSFSVTHQKAMSTFFLFQALESKVFYGKRKDKKKKNFQKQNYFQPIQFTSTCHTHWMFTTNI